ncbi:MAG: glycosyltransferase family 39 protein, partial [Bacteroidota bacterium]
IMANNLESGGHLKGAAAWFAGLVILVVAVAAGLRFYDLFALPLTNDETSALMRLNAKSVSELLGTVVWNDGHPMLVQVFLWYWTKWFGTAVWLVKLPFLLCGLGSVILMIRIGIRLGAAWTGLLAAAMLATLQFPLMYSEIARPYAPGLLLSLWAFYVWLRWLEVCKTEVAGINLWAKPLILLSIAGYLGASNHYFNGLILALLFVSGLVILPRNRWIRYLWPWLLCAALYMHQIGIFMHHLQVGSPGWLQVPTWKSLFKHFMYCFGYSLWPIHVWLLGVLLGELIQKRKIKWLGFDQIQAGLKGSSSVADGLDSSEKHQNRAINRVIWLLYLAPLLIAYFYSVYRAPVFQDSVLLFSFGFGLLGFALWVDRKALSLRLKAGLVVLTLLVNLYVLLVDRNHRELFNNQSYDAAVKTLKRWKVVDDVSRGDAMWVYGFESFFMEYHAQELGLALGKWQKNGGDLQYFRDETVDYASFRKKLRAVKGDDFYYLNMVGMDPMLRVWIQRAFPVLRSESMGPGYHIMHFSKFGEGNVDSRFLRDRVSPVWSGQLALRGDIDSSQYRQVLSVSTDSLGEQRYSAEFVAVAVVELDTQLLRRRDLRLVVMINNGAGENIRYVDQGIGNMSYEMGEVEVLDGGRCRVNLYLAARLVDVEWGGDGIEGQGVFRGIGTGLASNINHFATRGYDMQIFIDNAGRKPVAVKTLRIDFWPGNGSVYGLVNPVIP